MTILNVWWLVSLSSCCHVDAVCIHRHKICIVLYSVTVTISAVDLHVYFCFLVVCKIFVHELKDRLVKLNEKKEVLRLGQGLDESKKKAVSYEKSWVVFPIISKVKIQILEFHWAELIWLLNLYLWLFKG